MRFFTILAAVVTAATAAHALTINDGVAVERRANGKTCLSRRAGSSATVTSFEQCNGVCNSWVPARMARAVKRQSVTDLKSCIALCNQYFPAAASSAAAVKPSSSSAKPSSATSSSNAPAASSSSKAAVSSSSRPAVASSAAAPASSNKAAVSSAAAPASTSKAPASSAAAAPASTSKAATTTATAPAPTDATIKAFVDAHNAARAAYGAGPVTWNAELATFAAKTAATCKMAHSGGPYGENLAAGTGNYNANSAVNGWMSEASQYNYNSPGFSSATGHFTQVVWKGTTEIGCAIKVCADGTIFTGYGNSNFIVCEYKAPGNYQGAFPANVGQKV